MIYTLTQTLVLDSHLYAFIKSLSILFLYIVLTSQKKRTSYFFIWAMYCIYFLIQPKSFVSFSFFINLVLLSSLFYIFFEKEKTLYKTISFYLSCSFSVVLTLFFHYYFASDFIWFIMNQFDLYLSKDYDQFLFLVDFVMSILCFGIVLIPKNKRLFISITFYITSFMFICLSIFFETNLYILIPVTLIVLLIIICTFYHIYLNLKKQNELSKIETEIEMNKLYYNNYKEHYQRLELLKHDIVKALGNHQNVPKELYNEIDSLITPYISIYSSNSTLNMVLTEIVATLKELKIKYELIIAEDFTFLNEQEIAFLFRFIFQKLIQFKNMTYFSIETKKELNNVSLILSYCCQDSILLKDYSTHPIYQQLIHKYKLWEESIEIDNIKYVVFNLIITEEGENSND